jgi:hypothetical protein
MEPSDPAGDRVARCDEDGSSFVEVTPRFRSLLLPSCSPRDRCRSRDAGRLEPKPTGGIGGVALMPDPPPPPPFPRDDPPYKHTSHPLSMTFPKPHTP